MYGMQQVSADYADACAFTPYGVHGAPCKCGCSSLCFFPLKHVQCTIMHGCRPWAAAQQSKIFEIWNVNLSEQSVKFNDMERGNTSAVKTSKHTQQAKYKQDKPKSQAEHHRKQASIKQHSVQTRSGSGSLCPKWKVKRNTICCLALRCPNQYPHILHTIACY